MELLGTKAEIKLKKAEPVSWRTLELVKPPKPAEEEDDKKADDNSSAVAPADAETNTQTDKEKA